MTRVCPDPLMLSAYLDGKLDAPERRRIEDHISRCEDCYFVVKETALVWKEAEDSAPRRASGLFPGRFVLPIAASLIVGVGALALWRQAHPEDQYKASVRPLVEAVGERRFVEPRLTGGFRFGPLEGAKRGAKGTDAERWSVLASAAELKKKADESPTALHRRALAAAELMMDETEAAVSLLEQLARDAPRDAGVRNDLAAAYISRARGAGREDDWPRALEASEQAIHLDPLLIEARFNRAYALESMSLWAEAEKAWLDYLTVAGAARDGWAEEANRHLDALRKRPSSDLERRN